MAKIWGCCSRLYFGVLFFRDGSLFVPQTRSCLKGFSPLLACEGGGMPTISLQERPSLQETMVSHTSPSGNGSASRRDCPWDKALPQNGLCPRRGRKSGVALFQGPKCVRFGLRPPSEKGAAQEERGRFAARRPKGYQNQRALLR